MKTVLQKWFNGGHKTFKKQERLLILASAILLVLAGALVFYVRYPFAFDAANFYAEDGKVFMKNLIELGPVLGSLQLFNGYLIVGQYIVGVAALGINEVAGSGFVTLPKAVAVASYLFFGFVCMLPWLLFRKRLGTALSLIVVVLLWATPLGSYDAAVIGTIGNLKFSFLFIAVLLIIYRNDAKLCTRTWQFVAVDIALLLCVCTNIVTIGLLPFALIRYRNTIVDTAKNLSTKQLLKAVKISGLLMLAGLAMIAALYLIAVYVSGIPKQPGYLDQPLDVRGLLPLVYRATMYGIFFPVNYLMNGVFIVLSLLGLLAVLVTTKYRAVAAVIAAALLFNIAGFVYNRTGVTHHFLTFSDGAWPGHFFMAGTMIVVFGAAYIVADWFKQLPSVRQFYAVCGAVVVFALVLPAAGFTKTNPYATTRPALAGELERICTDTPPNTATIEVYPAAGWTMELDGAKACARK